MESLLDLQQPKSMSSKRKHESMDLSSNSENDHYDEMKPPIGIEFGRTPSPGEYSRSQPIFEYNIIGPCVQSLRTLAHQQLWSEKFMSSVVALGLENLVVHGTKQRYLLTLKIQDPNSGMGIVIKDMLLSMSFEEVSIFPICLDGWIDIQSGWRSKAQACPCVLKSFGSRAMFIQQNGGLNWTLQH